MATTKQTICLSLSDDVLSAVDYKRQLAPRSAFIEMIIRKELELPGSPGGRKARAGEEQR